MSRRARRVVVALTSLLLLAAPATARNRFPEFSAPVVDAANVVPNDVEQRIGAELLDYQRRSGNQIAVAVVDTTGRTSLEDYTIDLAKAWGVGTADDDNGVLLLIAYEDRRLRIEVGEGLEGDLTDIESGRIIRNHITPRLRAGEVGQAVEAGTREIRRALGDTQVGAPLPVAEEPEEGADGGSLSWILPLIFFLAISSGIGRRRGRRRRGFGIFPVFWGGGWGSGSSTSDSGGFGGFSGGGGFGGGGGGDFGGGGASGSW